MPRAPASRLRRRKIKKRRRYTKVPRKKISATDIEGIKIDFQSISESAYIADILTCTAKNLHIAEGRAGGVVMGQNKHCRRVPTADPTAIATMTSRYRKTDSILWDRQAGVISR